jgi:hypothetical protein
MWESRRDFQRVWEGWEAGFMAFHAFHTLPFPWPVCPATQINQLRHLAQYTAPATTAYRDRLSMSVLAISHHLTLLREESQLFVVAEKPVFCAVGFTNRSSPTQIVGKLGENEPAPKRPT